MASLMTSPAQVERKTGGPRSTPSGRNSVMTPLLAHASRHRHGRHRPRVEEEAERARVRRLTTGLPWVDSLTTLEEMGKRA